jgi:hypothetical protein
LAKRNITINIDGLALGVYNYTISASDANGNIAIDSVYVSVVDGTPPSIDNPEDIIYDEFDTGSSISWSPNDLYPSNYTVYFDGEVFKSGLWNSSLETIAVSVDGLSYGIYIFTIVVMDVGSNTVSSTVWVTVIENSRPLIDSPNDIEYDEFLIGNSITWSPSDSHPLNYTVYLEGEVYKAGAWNSTLETITVSVDGLSYGTYILTIIVMDVGLKWASDVVLVKVTENIPPTIDGPNNFQYVELSTNNTILWSPIDPHPFWYTVYANGSVYGSQPWNGSSIEVDVDGLGLGMYNFTIVVEDVDGNIATDTVMVTVVDGTAPTLDSPPDVLLIEGGTDYTIAWSPSDLHPVSYTITNNDELVASGPWNSSDERISYSLALFSMGTYNLTLEVTDIGANTATDSVLVTILGATTPTGTPVPPDCSNALLITLVGGLGVAVIIVIIILVRRRQG